MAPVFYELYFLLTHLIILLEKTLIKRLNTLPFVPTKLGQSLDPFYCENRNVEIKTTIK